MLTGGNELMGWSNGEITVNPAYHKTNLSATGPNTVGLREVG